MYIEAYPGLILFHYGSVLISVGFLSFLVYSKSCLVPNVSFFQTIERTQSTVYKIGNTEN